MEHDNIRGYQPGQTREIKVNSTSEKARASARDFVSRLNERGAWVLGSLNCQEILAVESDTDNSLVNLVLRVDCWEATGLCFIFVRADRYDVECYDSNCKVLDERGLDFDGMAAALRKLTAGSARHLQNTGEVAIGNKRNQMRQQ